MVKNIVKRVNTVAKEQSFSSQEALSKVKELAYAKFDESVDVECQFRH